MGTTNHLVVLIGLKFSSSIKIMEDNNNDIKNNEELVFNCIKSEIEDGIAELLQHLNNIPIELVTSPSFINKLEHTLKDDSISDTIPLISIIENNYPSNSLLFLEYLKNKGIYIKQLICSPQLCISFINSSLRPCGTIIDQIMLKNNMEGKAQLELVKMIIELSFDLKDFEDEMINSALESLNLKIIKYFVSLNIGDIINKKRALCIALQRKSSLSGKEQQKYRLKLIKYIVDQGADIHQIILTETTKSDQKIQFYLT